jgi:hypothetical protein
VKEPVKMTYTFFCKGDIITGCLKRSFITLKAHINVFSGHVQYSDLP